MKQYMETKIVKAEPATRYELPNGAVLIQPDSDKRVFALDYRTIEERGYELHHADGSKSWCPKAEFEKAYFQTDRMSFGQAIEAAKVGKKIARMGWNGKSQYIELAYGISYKNHGGDIVNCDHEAIGNRAFAFVGASGVQLGWLASQADMLAEDWYIVE